MFHTYRLQEFHLVTLLLVALPTCIQASFLGTLLFGKDTLEPVRAAIRQTEQLRQEVFGWYTHNATQQANFTVTPDPAILYSLLPANYSGRSLVSSDGSYYSEIEGYYKGEWTGWDFSTQANRSIALESKLNHTAAEKHLKEWQGHAPEYIDGVKPEKLVSDRGSFKWLAAQAGNIELHMQEEHLLPNNVSLITGSLSFEAPLNAKSTVDSVDFSLEGLHFIPTGSIFLHAVADEAPQGTDVRTSLDLIPQNNNGTTNATVSAIDKAFQLRIDMLQRIIAGGSFDAGDDGSEERTALKHNCSLHVYAQFRSAGPSGEVQPQIDALEHEMLVSTGISTISPPPLKLALIAYSPECRLILSSDEVIGLLQRRIWKKVVRYAIIYSVVLFIQTRLLVQQMEVTTTPSGLAKVSDKTWLVQSVLDAYGCLVHLSFGVALENETTVPLIVCAFMSGMCFLAFGYRYTITIHRSQMDAAPSPVPAPAQNNPASVVTGDQAHVPPGQNGAVVDAEPQINATAPPTNFFASTIAAITSADTSSATPEEIQTRRRGATIFFVGMFLLMVVFFPIFTFALMLPFLYSFWIPQIYRNVQRGTRKSILKRCVIGTTFTRLFIPMYFLVCPDNIMFGEPSVWGWILTAYVSLQAAVLVGQDLFGPHWFLPKKWAPEGVATGWEYHPTLEEENEEEVQGEREYGDCAICLTVIQSKTRRRTRRKAENSSKRERGRAWSAQISSDYPYDRIAEDAEDFKLDLDDDFAPSENTVQIYPPEKRAGGTGRSDRRDRMPFRANTSGGISQRLRLFLARTVRAAIRWKENLGSTSTLGRRRRMDVMLAPCQHAFHTECLERWLQIKNECPSCRSVLPPV